MIIQKIEIESEEAIKDLYIRTEGKIKDKFVQLNKNQIASYDTYVNMFSAAKWRKYTKVTDVYLRMEYRGHCVVNLCTVTNEGVDECVIMSEEIESDNYAIYESKNLNIEDLGDICYISINSLSESEILSVAFASNIEKVNNVKLACGICTYKREAELKANLDVFTEEILNNQNSILYNHFDIYVADNGHTIDARMFENEHIFLFDNKNYGGSAGFTRCLIEARFNSGIDYTNMLLLDDDAQTKAYVIERIATFIMVMKEEYRNHLIGGSLLALEKPNMLMEQGGLYTPNKLILRKQFVDVSNKKNVVQSEESENINYNGWFLACFPFSIISENNLPLPFFIHGDDIEYGFQFNGNVIHLNGISVWHPNPLVRGGQRDYIAYYDMRNFSIINSCYYQKETMRRIAINFVWRVLASAVVFRYDRAWYIIRGYEDFAKGVDWLRCQNAELLNREVMNWRKPEKCIVQDTNEIELLDGKDIIGWQLFALINWIIPSWKRKNVNAAGYKYKVNYLGVKEMNWIDIESGEGVVLRKDYKELARVLKGIICVIGKINSEAVKQYDMQKLGILKSLEFWKEYLEI